VDEIEECKQINNYHRECKQNHPVQETRVDEECEAEMLQPIRTILASCSQIFIGLNQTLDGNKWLYVSRRPDTLTVLCSKHEPTDVEITGTGKLKLKKYVQRLWSKSPNSRSDDYFDQ
jgi:hypothetical protein